MLFIKVDLSMFTYAKLVMSTCTEAKPCNSLQVLIRSQYNQGCYNSIYKPLNGNKFKCPKILFYYPK